MPFANLDHYRQRAKTLTLRGHKIAFWHQGEGDNLLLLHGFPSASYDWYRLWPALTQRYHVIAVDLLGFGLSAKPHPYPFSLLEQADIVEALLDELIIDECHVMAHDYGVSVAQECLLRQQHGKLGFRLSSLCWLNGGLFAEAHKPLAIQRALGSSLGPLLTRFVSKGTFARNMRRLFSGHSPLRQQDLNALWQLLKQGRGPRCVPALLRYLQEREVHRDEWVATMQQTRVPQLLLSGNKGPVCGEPTQARFDELLPKATSHSLDTGHYPHLEAPDQVLALWQRFVRGLPSQVSGKPQSRYPNDKP